jgi:hypothetical protein
VGHAIRTDVESLYFRKARQQIGPPCPTHEDSRAQGFGKGGTRGDNSAQAGVLERQAGTGVQDVAGTGSQASPQAVRGGERAILAPQDTEDFLLCQTAHENKPTPCVRRRTERIQAALTKVDKDPGRTSGLEQLDEPIHGVALADTTEIQASPWGKFDPSVGRQVKGGARDVTRHPG